MVTPEQLSPCCARDCVDFNISRTICLQCCRSCFLTLASWSLSRCAGGAHGSGAWGVHCDISKGIPWRLLARLECSGGSQLCRAGLAAVWPGGCAALCQGACSSDVMAICSLLFHCCGKCAHKFTSQWSMVSRTCFSRFINGVPVHCKYAVMSPIFHSDVKTKHVSAGPWEAASGVFTRQAALGAL
jgi:hypothetical protein